MASALGWYIHLTAKGYEEHGLNPPRTLERTGDEVTSKSIISVCTQQRDLIKKRISKMGQVNNKAREALAELFNYGKKYLSSPSSQEAIEARHEVEQQVYKTVSQNIADINWDTWGVRVRPGVNQEGWIGVGKTLRSYDAVKNLLTAAEKLLRLDAVVTKAIEGKLTLAGQGIPEEVQKAVIKLKNDYNVFFDLYGTTLEKFVKSQGSINKLKSTDHRKSIIEMRKRLIDLIQTYAPYPALSKAIGEMGEYTILAILNMMPTLAQGVVSKECQDLLLNSQNWSQAKHTGTSPVVRSMDIEQFETSYFTGKGKQTQISDRLAKVIAEAHSSSNKVDIAIQYKGNPLNLSIKNYDLSDNSRWVHLVNDSSLLYMLQQASSIEFTNHVLNAYAKHESVRGISGKVREARQQLKQEIQLTLLLQALTGGVDGANLLVINDTSTASKGVKLYTVSEIMEQAEHSLELSEGPISISMANDSSANNMDSLYFENTKVVADSNKTVGEAVQERIENVLIDAYSKKVKVGLKIAILKSITTKI